MKRRLLGRPLVSEDLHGERLGKPTALAVLSSDVMSSCAYATESILRILVPVVGVAAFALVTPITALLLAVLGLVCLCYRQVVKTYPVSGGSYVVSRENFGFAAAQIPGAALLISYVLTVAVSIAAGVDAVISAFPVLTPYPVELSVACVVLLTYGNLRGIREAGRIFAVPTYLFLASMASLVITGAARWATGGLHDFTNNSKGVLPLGHAGGGLLLGASVFIFLRGLANGGSAMTGMEAISNAVPVFRDPKVRNARTTLVLMASILGVMFVAVSILAALTHAAPFVSGTPTVLSRIGDVVFGHTLAGRGAYFLLQFSTALILILGANTSFNGFPLLVSFIAEDAYLPRPLRTRGHRLVYSNGIVALAVVSVLVLVITGAQVASLIPLYACAVFVGFTMAGAGMTKYQLNHPDGRRFRDLAVPLAAFIASAAVTLIFVVAEFTRGAWLVVVCIPLIVLVLSQTNRRYEAEKRVLAEGSDDAGKDKPLLRRHVVLVLIDTVDLATARAVQLARSLAGASEVRAVHFVLDAARARSMAKQWNELGRWRLPLDLVDCPDRRLARAATELVADIAAGGDTEVTLVLPRRIYKGFANRLLHANTADRIVAAVSTVPNVSATVAPFDVSGILRRMSAPEPKARTADSKLATAGDAAAEAPEAPEAPVKRKRERAQVVAVTNGAGQKIRDITYRRRCEIAGRVQAIRVQPWSGVQVLECTLVDGTGSVSIVFLGRSSIPGL
ncbi:MAG TPA: amino acid permease, partial [Acidimicrobiales bacterium]|nr:amino acid permease [Acidimicrobiales bacterium]